MNIVLDTNIFLSDLTFKKAEFKALSDYLNTAGGFIILPKVIDQEVRKNVRSRSWSEQDKIKSLLASRLGLIEKQPVAEDIEKEVITLYENYISDNGSFPMDNTVDLEAVVQRSLEEKAPFKTEGRGLRDTLIWFNILEFMKSRRGQSLVFVSNNGEDFGKKELKPELQEEIDAIEGGGKLYYYNDLSEFLNIYGQKIQFITGNMLHESIDKYLKTRSFTNIEDQLSDHIDISRSTSSVEIIEAQYEDLEINNYYIYNADTENYYVYAEVAINFGVGLDISSEDWEWDPINEDMKPKYSSRNEYRHSWIWREYSLKISKKTKQVVEIEDYDGNA